VTEPEASDFDACALCGRTILRGEQLFEYVTAEGQRHGVCALCRKRAESMGWMPAHLADELPPVHRPEPVLVTSDPEPATGSLEDDAAVEPAPLIRKERSVFEQALDAFNAAEPAHRIAGLRRSLGDPNVAIEEFEDGVTVTVAWELSWYRWEVRVGALGSEIEEVAKGSEMAEIEPSPLWNARTDEYGRVEPARA
jgi:hypothetical protein